MKNISLKLGCILTKKITPRNSLVSKTRWFWLMSFTFFNLISQTIETSISPILVVLGVVQDGGLPHIGCAKSCCSNLTPEQGAHYQVTALAVKQPKINTSILFEASPDIVSQWNQLENSPTAVFLTHAHIGHYTGLMHLGREALGAKNIPVYVMPRMRSYLKSNAPWSQLVELKNIKLIKMTAERPKTIGSVQITPILVPHRDEFSETVGYRIQGPNKTALFLPDIDKWERWNTDLAEILKTVDYAFIDATFFDEAELDYRPIDEIPHPLVKETIALLEASPNHLKKKVYFIHMNHTNPMLNPNSTATKWVLNQGFNIARKGQSFGL